MKPRSKCEKTKRNRKILAAYMNGVTPKELAKHYRCGKANIWRIIYQESTRQYTETIYKLRAEKTSRKLKNARR